MHGLEYGPVLLDFTNEMIKEQLQGVQPSFTLEHIVQSFPQQGQEEKEEALREFATSIQQVIEETEKVYASKPESVRYSKEEYVRSVLGIVDLETEKALQKKVVALRYGSPVKPSHLLGDGFMILTASGTMGACNGMLNESDTFSDITVGLLTGVCFGSILAIGYLYEIIADGSARRSRKKIKRLFQKANAELVYGYALN